MALSTYRYGKGRAVIFVRHQGRGLWDLQPILPPGNCSSIILLFDLTSPQLIHLEDSLNYISQLHGGVSKLN